MAQHSGGSHGDAHEGSHGSLKSYVIGFVISIVLTIIPLVIVMNGMFAHKTAVIILLVAAILQFAVQLLFFMHLREEGKPRYNLITLIFGLVIVITVIGGSIWIMMNNTVY
jgi:cytochrome o ubiquinol oxidase operon protein cyoD